MSEQKMHSLNLLVDPKFLKDMLPRLTASVCNEYGLTKHEQEDVAQASYLILWGERYFCVGFSGLRDIER